MSRDILSPLVCPIYFLYTYPIIASFDSNPLSSRDQTLNFFIGKKIDFFCMSEGTIINIIARNVDPCDCESMDQMLPDKGCGLFGAPSSFELLEHERIGTTNAEIWIFSDLLKMYVIGRNCNWIQVPNSLSEILIFKIFFSISILACLPSFQRFFQSVFSTITLMMNYGCLGSTPFYFPSCDCRPNSSMFANTIIQ